MVNEETRGLADFPTISWRNVLHGMLVMNVVSGIAVLGFLGAYPILLFLVAGLRHNSIFTIHALFYIGMVVTVSLELNVLFVGAWVLLGLFGSVGRQWFVLIVLGICQVVILSFGYGRYVDSLLLVSVAGVVAFDLIWGWRGSGGRIDLG